PPRPPGAKRLVARVVDEGSTVAVVGPHVGATSARLAFHLAAIPGKRVVLAEEVFVGWSPAPPPVHLRVTFTRLLTRRSMDPSCASCPNAESKLGQQIVSPPGEWLVYSNVAGIWKRWPGIFHARDGSLFPLRLTQDVFLP